MSFNHGYNVYVERPTMFSKRALHRRTMFAKCESDVVQPSPPVLVSSNPQKFGITGVVNPADNGTGLFVQVLLALQEEDEEIATTTAQTTTLPVTSLSNAISLSGVGLKAGTTYRVTAAKTIVHKSGRRDSRYVVTRAETVPVETTPLDEPDAPTLSLASGSGSGQRLESLKFQWVEGANGDYTTGTSSFDLKYQVDGDTAIATIEDLSQDTLIDEFSQGTTYSMWLTKKATRVEGDYTYNTEVDSPHIPVTTASLTGPSWQFGEKTFTSIELTWVSPFVYEAQVTGYLVEYQISTSPYSALWTPPCGERC